MIAIAVVALLAIGVIALLTLAVLEGRNVYIEHRAERLQIEREKRWAEKRLHRLSAEAFDAMLKEARRSSVSDPNRQA